MSKFSKKRTHIRAAVAFILAVTALTANAGATVPLSYIENVKNDIKIIDTASAEENKETVEIIAVTDIPAVIERMGDIPRDEYLGSEKAESDRAEINAVLDKIKTSAAEICPDIEFICDYDVIFAGFAANVPKEYVDELRQLENIDGVYYSNQYEPDKYQTMMASAAPYVGSDTVISEGFGGEGTVIAIIDNGFDTGHEIFTLPEKTKVKLTEEKMEKRYLVTNAYSFTPEYGTYISDKIPFAYDYADHDTDVLNSSDHGTHVAAIAAGNHSDGETFNGAAPQAQLLLMKVYSDDSVYSDDIATVAALEDAVSLGADVINFSLGVPSGSVYEMYNFNLGEAVERVIKSGVIFVAAGGNDGKAGSGSYYDLNYGITKPTTDYTDYGYVADPSVFPDAISVASAENYIVPQIYLYSSSDTKIRYNETSAVLDGSSDKSFTDEFAGKTTEYVYVSGIGEKSDFEKVNVSGKIALIERGTITFSEKIQNAADAGAVGVIIFNSKGADSIYIQADDPALPAISISYEDGQALISAEKKTVRIPKTKYSLEENPDGGKLSSFSSWGTTPELTLKPEITGIGGNILSAVVSESDDEYNFMSGTSMACPMISGIAAAVKSNLIKNGTLPPDDLVPEYMKLCLMSSATPLLDENGVEISPRAQGAGIANAYDAIHSEILLKSGEYQPKIELGENIGQTYSLKVTAVNNSDKAAEFILSATAASDGYETENINDQNINFISDTPYAFAGAEITVEGGKGNNINRHSKNYAPEKFTLGAGESREFTLNVKIDDSDFKRYKKVFKNGFFAEGFIYLEYADSKNSPDYSASIPYMGYVGDWDRGKLFDGLGYDGNNTFYPNQYVAVNSPYDIAISGIDNVSFKAYSDLIAISPNGDGWGDEMLFSFMPLRNIRQIDVYVTSEDTGEEISMGSSYNFTKTCYSDLADNFQYLYIWDGSDGIGSSYIMPDGRYICRIYAYWNDDRTQTVEFPIMLDTESPEISEVTFETDSETGKKFMKISAKDNHYISKISAYLPNAELDMDSEFALEDMYFYNSKIDVKYEENVHDSEVCFDITDFDKSYIYVTVDDYAMNSKTIRVDIDD